MTAPQPIDAAAEIKSLKAELAKVQKRQAQSEFHAAIPDMTPAQLNAAVFTCMDAKDYKGLELALRAGGDANATRSGLSGTGNTPLTYQYADAAAVRLLLQYKADPNLRSGLGTLPLVAALSRKDTGSFAALMAGGADANQICSKDGGTVVHAAAASRNVDFLYHCKSADMNARDGRGRNALMIAIANGDVAMAQAAIEYGSSIKQRDNQGQSVKQLAAASGNAALVKLIKKTAKKQDYRATKDRIKTLEKEMAVLKEALLAPKKAAKPCKTAKKCCAKAHKKA